MTVRRTGLAPHIAPRVLRAHVGSRIREQEVLLRRARRRRSVAVAAHVVASRYIRRVVRGAGVARGAFEVHVRGPAASSTVLNDIRTIGSTTRDVLQGVYCCVKVTPVATITIFECKHLSRISSSRRIKVNNILSSAIIRLLWIWIHAEV